MVLYSTTLLGQIIDIDNLRYGTTNSITELRDSLWIIERHLESTSYVQSVWKSAEGINWQQVMRNDEKQIYLSSKAIAFKGKLYSIGGKHTDVGTNHIWTSVYGKKWTREPNPPFSGRQKLGVVVHNNKLFVVAGSGKNDVWYTRDGTTWQQATSQLSTDFPHFWRPELISYNNKLILIGGRETDVGGSNEKGVYISEDDGKNWIRHEFNHSADLAYVDILFVYNNKLWLAVDQNPNIKYVGQNYLKKSIKFFTSEDGIAWEEVADKDHDMLMLATQYKSKAYVFNGKVMSFNNQGYATGVKYTTFTEPEIYIKNVASFIKNQSTPNTFTVPFKYHHTDVTNSNPITFMVTSSDNSVIAANNIIIKDTEIEITKTGEPGYTTINIQATDGITTSKEQFEVLVYPDANVYITGKNSYIMDVNGSIKTPTLKIYTFTGYGTNNLTVESTDHSFIDPSEVTFKINPHPLFKGHYWIGYGSSFNTSAEGSAVLTVTASDGNGSFNFDIYVKVGGNNKPELSGTLSPYLISAGEVFNYQLPHGTFTDPDNDKITYSAKDMPFGLIIDSDNGDITGRTLTKPPYNITIVATDIYGASSEVILNVQSDGTAANTAPSDIKLSANSINENEAEGTLVATLTASDPDTGDVITFTVDDNDNFKISDNKLMTNKLFNFELKSSYTVRITATDNHSAATSSEFTIDVNDLNEVPLNISLSNTTVDDNVNIGYELGKLTASDPDSGDILTLTIADNDFFELKNSSVVVKGNLKEIKTDSYTISATATDNGGLSLTNEIILTLNKATTDIDRSNITNFTVAPNPVNNILSIKKETNLTSSTVRITVTNINGINLYSSEFNTVDDFIIDMSAFKSGIYLVSIVSNSGTELHKIIKQ